MGKPAFAYIDDDGEIDIATVSPTERAAKVNTIMMATYANIIPLNSWDDDTIDLVFLDATGGVGAVKCVAVTEVEWC